MTETNTPIIAIHKLQGGETSFVINLEDIFADDVGPIIPGIILSDLLDHLANALHQVTDRDVRDIRADILQVMRNEDRFESEEAEKHLH